MTTNVSNEMHRQQDSSVIVLQPVAECAENEEVMEEEVQVVVVGSFCQNSQQLKAALAKLRVPVVYSLRGEEYINSLEDDVETVFLYNNFEDDIFKRLRDADCRIIGPPVVFKCAEEGKDLPLYPRPLYSMVMNGLVICFAGLRCKEELTRLADRAHHMGASIRKDFSFWVTHLVAKSTGGEKYRAAVSLGTAIMTSDWIEKIWECRDDVNLDAKGEQFEGYKMSPFYNCILVFYGFEESDKSHMEELAVSNGGTVGNITECHKATHVVMNDASVKQLPMDIGHKINVVKSEWFWGSIQMNACANEDMYRFSSHDSVMSPASRYGRTLSTNRTRRRRRLRDNLAQLAQEGEAESPFYSKRQSTDLSRMSLSASLLDYSADTSVVLGENQAEQENTDTAQGQAKVTARMQVVKELLQTEANYVGILETILRIFKDSIEDPEQPGGPLLPAKDIDHIFGGLPPIYNLHVQIRDDLMEIITNWTEEARVGDVIQKHAGAMEKAYPTFVNFFEKTKETINRCDKTVPRFHAFLKRCLMKPECGRQSLAELIIRPVQRLPSVMLLLGEILKHTPKSNADHSLLEQALASLKSVMMHINEDKRKTERQMAMFEIIHDIENCPPTLLSAHRQLISRINVVQISDEPGVHGDQITLFLFSDYLEICKRRTRAALQSYRSPSTVQRPYRHIELLTLPSIKRVVDITETEEIGNVFAMICRPTAATKEKLFTFMLIPDETKKEDYLTTMCKQIANTTCRTDYENLLVNREASSLEIDTSEINNQSFSTKAKRFASRTRKRVGRMFSFSVTPHKLKRSNSSAGENVSPFQTPRSTPRSSGALGSRLATSTINLEALSETACSPTFHTPLPIRRMETPNSDSKALRPSFRRRIMSTGELLSQVTSTLSRRKRRIIMPDIGSAETDSPNQSMNITPSMSSLPILSLRSGMATVLGTITDSPQEMDETMEESDHNHIKK